MKTLIKLLETFQKSLITISSQVNQKIFLQNSLERFKHFRKLQQIIRIIQLLLISILCILIKVQKKISIILKQILIKFFTKIQ